MGLTAGKEGGRPADKIRVDFIILKLLYRLSYSDFYFVEHHCNFTEYLNCIQSAFVKLKYILRCVLKCEKFGSHFFHVNLYY